MTVSAAVKGGSFLVSDTDPASVFTPEDLTAEHLDVLKKTQEFVRADVQPLLSQIISQIDLPLNRKLLLRAGELGLLGADVPKEYGGMGLDKIASTIVVAASAAADVFSLTWNDHSGIGMIPLVIFGNKAQKAKYLPGLVRANIVGSYALTEPSAGSDALSIKTNAVLSPDGKHYILNGDKLFITNGSLADVFMTYAKVDGDKFTAFIIERAFPGVSTGMEIKKMGLHGSSTTALRLKDAQIPVENVLHEIGRGHEVAFCTLDLGRFRLAVVCAEDEKFAIEHSVKYAVHRQQFGKTLSQFGLIQQKLANMAINAYVSESMVYRTAGLLSNAAIKAVDVNSPTYAKDMYKNISSLTIECSVGKVLGSEALSDVVDDAVQIFGGRGYIEGNPVERMYRDSRINRIFEGTNEINRLLMVRWLLRKAVTNEIPLFSTAMDLMKSLPVMKPTTPLAGDGPLDYQKRLLAAARNVFVLMCGAAAQKYGKNIEDEQEILAYLADMIMRIWAMESGLLRAAKSITTVGEAKSALKIDMMRVYVNDSLALIENHARLIIAAMETGDAAATQLGMLRKIVDLAPVNTVAARRRVAAAIIEAQRYVC